MISVWRSTDPAGGLIQDWTLWQKEKGANFELLQGVLKTLSPSPEEELVPGLPTRTSLDDVRDIPTIRMPYGQDVPVLHVSAGMKRVLALDKAAGFLLGGTRDLQGAAHLDQQLRTLLSDTDPFWARWRYVGERQGWLK